MSRPGSSTNAERALDILLIVGEVGPEGLSLAAIAERIGIAKSVAHRSLTSLLQKGFVEPAERYGWYRLGPSVEMLARRQQRLDPQVQRHRPGMSEFARRTGFTVYLMVQAGVDAVCAEITSRSTRPQFGMGVGARVPMGVGAGSLALLSVLPEDVAERIVAANAERFLRYPQIRHVDAAVVRAQVREAQVEGYAVNMGYYLPGEGGLGVPIRASSPYEVDVAVSFNAPVEMMERAWVGDAIADLRRCLDL